ncbi:hypothetical protein F8M41_000084 [Gigaspora margarita]|uniref:Uncharacterized protein n=1 Tax=Gigaspora margarita TaxID=4874 RepID=A0A8H4EVS0_GIGMA|nr:hypothetical protein F8M41_000084 [Gigaspora margarita]
MLLFIRSIGRACKMIKEVTMELKELSFKTLMSRHYCSRHYYEQETLDVTNNSVEQETRDITNNSVEQENRDITNNSDEQETQNLSNNSVEQEYQQITSEPSVSDIIINSISKGGKTNEEVFNWLSTHGDNPKYICLLG